MKLMPQKGQIINVQAYKFDHTLYRQLNGLKVIDVTPKMIVVFALKTKVEEEKGHRWIIKEPQLWFFPVDVYYNTTVLLRDDGNWFYTNLSSPVVYEEGTLKFIDFDLDVKMYPDKRLKVVDQQDYEKHKYKFKYDAATVAKIDATIIELVDYWYAKQSYFNPTVIAKYIEILKDQKLIIKKRQS